MVLIGGINDNRVPLPLEIFELKNKIWHNSNFTITISDFGALSYNSSIFYYGGYDFKSDTRSKCLIKLDLLQIMKNSNYK